MSYKRLLSCSGHGQLTETECRQYLHVSACPASARTAPPVAGGAGAPLPEVGGPEGAFRFTISAQDLPIPPFAKGDERWNTGDFTWYLMGGSWQYHQEYPVGFGDDWAGTYVVSGDQITITVGQGDPQQLPRAAMDRSLVAPGRVEPLLQQHLVDGAPSVPSADDQRCVGADGVRAASLATR